MLNDLATPSHFRVYLLGPRRQLLAAFDVATESKTEAVQRAVEEIKLLPEARGYELWRNARCVTRGYVAP